MHYNNNGQWLSGNYPPVSGWRTRDNRRKTELVYTSRYTYITSLLTRIYSCMLSVVVLPVPAMLCDIPVDRWRQHYHLRDPFSFVIFAIVKASLWIGIFLNWRFPIHHGIFVIFQRPQYTVPYAPCQCGKRSI